MAFPLWLQWFFFYNISYLLCLWSLCCGHTFPLNAVNFSLALLVMPLVMFCHVCFWCVWSHVIDLVGPYYSCLCLIVWTVASIGHFVWFVFRVFSIFGHLLLWEMVFIGGKLVCMSSNSILFLLFACCFNSELFNLFWRFAINIDTIF